MVMVSPHLMVVMKLGLCVVANVKQSNNAKFLPAQPIRGRAQMSLVMASINFF